jgi:hypothetical protein
VSDRLGQPLRAAGRSAWWSVLLGAVTAGLTAGSLPFAPIASRDRILVAGLVVSASWVALACRKTPPTLPVDVGSSKAASYATSVLCLFLAGFGPRLLILETSTPRLPLIAILYFAGCSAALLLLTAARLLGRRGTPTERSSPTVG